MKITFSTILKTTALIVVIGVLSVIVYDILFSDPLVMRGVIVDKMHVPSSTQSGQNIVPYMKGRTYDHLITAQKEEQWIAFVKIDDGNILKVNCHIHHYEQTQVGDTLQFKEYTGEIFHIDYFSHNEEDASQQKAS